MRTRPLTLAAIGVATVAFDPRIVAVDAAPDVVGWTLIAVAAWQLSLAWPCRLAVVAALASVAELELPYHYDSLDPITGEVVPHARSGQAFHERLAFDSVHGPRLALLVAAVAAGGVALALLLHQLTRRAASSRDQTSARRLELFRYGVIGVWTLPYVVLAVGQGLFGDDGFDPVWNGGWELLAIAGLAVMAAVALSFAHTSNRRWSATGDDLGSPWAELMVRDQQP